MVHHMTIDRVRGRTTGPQPFRLVKIPPQFHPKFHQKSQFPLHFLSISANFFLPKSVRVDDVDNVPGKLVTGRPRRGGDRDECSSSSNSGLCFGERFARLCARRRGFCASSPLIRNTPFTCAHTQYLSLHRRRPPPLGLRQTPTRARGL